MFLRAYPAMPISGLVASLLILLAGLFSDLSPPPPTGELLPATVIAIERDSTGQGLTALMQVDTADGRIICGIKRADFPGQRLPAPHTELTVDYRPVDCALPPVSRELPRWAILAMGGGGAMLMVLWLWAGRRAGL